MFSKLSKTWSLLLVAFFAVNAEAGIVAAGKCSIRWFVAGRVIHLSSNLKRVELSSTGTLAAWSQALNDAVFVAARNDLKSRSIAIEQTYPAHSMSGMDPVCNYSLMPETVPSLGEKLRLMDLIQYYENRLYGFTVHRSVGGATITPYPQVRFIPTGGF